MSKDKLKNFLNVARLNKDKKPDSYFWSQRSSHEVLTAIKADYLLEDEDIITNKETLEFGFLALASILLLLIINPYSYINNTIGMIAYSDITTLHNMCGWMVKSW